MATVYFIKNGSRNLGNRTNEGIEKTAEEIISLLGNHKYIFLSDDYEEIVFNSTKPSDDYRHVVIEITAEEELNNEFKKIGFYVVQNLEPTKFIAMEKAAKAKK